MPLCRLKRQARNLKHADKLLRQLRTRLGPKFAFCRRRAARHGDANDGDRAVRPRATYGLGLVRRARSLRRAVDAEAEGERQSMYVQLVGVWRWMITTIRYE